MGGHKSFRQLSRSSSHRQALLRNLVTDLFKHESISTTYAKAKEAQSVAEHAITLAKKNTPASINRLKSFLYDPEVMVPKALTVLAPRYAAREGGYTRVQRIEPLRTDRAPSAILELVDGPRDMRFMLTAKVLAECARRGTEVSEITLKNVAKVTRFRKGGVEELERLVKRFRREEGGGRG